MKATKKIVGAACALVAAVALSAGSTFAWFAANGTVTASGISVSVQSDDQFLIIGAGTSNLAALQSASTTTYSFTETGVQLKPSAYATAYSSTSGDSTTYTVTRATPESTTIEQKAVVDTSSAGTAGWLTANANKSTESQGTAPGQSVTPLTDTNFSDYVKTYSCNLCIASGETVEVTCGITTNWDDTIEESSDTSASPIGVYVVAKKGSTDEGVVYSCVGASTLAADTATTITVGATEVTTVTIYVFYDGMAKTTTSYNYNAKYLTSGTVNLEFKIKTT